MQDLRKKADKKGLTHDEGEEVSPNAGNVTPPLKPMSKVRSLAAKLRSSKKVMILPSASCCRYDLQGTSSRSLLGNMSFPEKETLNSIDQQCQRMENMMKAMMNSIKNIDNRLVKVESNAAKNLALRTFPTKRKHASPGMSNASMMNMRLNVERGEKDRRTST